MLHRDVGGFALVLLEGVAGSGKTTLLRQWVDFEREAENPLFHISWVNFTDASDQPEIFWNQLNDAYAELISDFYITVEN
jgi:ATP/maltotriose-dependent transcriptional regulator MalT